MDKAIEALLDELEKDEFDFEGLVLLADIYEQKEDMVAAYTSILKLFNSGRLAGAQIENIEARKRELEEKVLIQRLNRVK